MLRAMATAASEVAHFHLHDEVGVGLSVCCKERAAQLRLAGGCAAARSRPRLATPRPPEGGPHLCRCPPLRVHPSPRGAPLFQPTRTHLPLWCHVAAHTTPHSSRRPPCVAAHCNWCAQVVLDRLLATRDALRGDPLLGGTKLTLLPLLIKASPWSLLLPLLRSPRSSGTAPVMDEGEMGGALDSSRQT